MRHLKYLLVRDYLDTLDGTPPRKDGHLGAMGDGREALEESECVHREPFRALVQALYALTVGQIYCRKDL